MAKCSFCHKPQEQVKKLMAAGDTTICNECVAVCNEVLAEQEDAKVWDFKETQHSYRFGMPKENSVSLLQAYDIIGEMEDLIVIALNKLPQMEKAYVILHAGLRGIIKKYRS